jgi:hypothetical protein
MKLKNLITEYISLTVLISGVVLWAISLIAAIICPTVIMLSILIGCTLIYVVALILYIISISRRVYGRY